MQKNTTKVAAQEVGSFAQGHYIVETLAHTSLRFVYLVLYSLSQYSRAPLFKTTEN